MAAVYPGNRWNGANYDTAGNVTGVPTGSQSFTYTGEGLVRTATIGTAPATVTQYSYDGLGRRVQKGGGDASGDDDICGGRKWCGIGGVYGGSDGDALRGTVFDVGPFGIDSGADKWIGGGGKTERLSSVWGGDWVFYAGRAYKYKLVLRRRRLPTLPDLLRRNATDAGLVIWEWANRVHRRALAAGAPQRAWPKRHSDNAYKKRAAGADRSDGLISRST